MNPTRRILVVEDEGITALDLQRTLVRMGYRVPRSVASGREAIEAADELALDLILCDIVLRGDMDGIEAATQILTRHQVPVVFLTAFGDLTTLQRARAANPYGYLIKPFHDEELRSTIETALLRFDLERRLAHSETRQRQLSASLQTMLERERTQLARDIHDELGQVLTHLRLELAWLQGHPGMERDQLVALSTDLLEVVDGAIKSVRRIASDLRPPILDEADIVSAIDWQCRRFADRSRLACSTELTLPRDITARLNKEASTALFRILQEALTNVARHAQARHVQVQLSAQSEWLELRVGDDGVGLQSHMPGERPGLGILGMGERVARWQGTVDVAPAAGGRGVEVVARLPLAAIVDFGGEP